MKNYKVTMSVLYKPTFEIKADSMQEAERIAKGITPEDIDNVCYTQGHTDILWTEVDEVVVDNRTLEDVKGALDRVTRQYIELSGEFAQYRAESIKWCVEDFLDYDHPTHTITPEQAQMALEHMINEHDGGIGITWDSVSNYIEMYGTRR